MGRLGKIATRAALALLVPGCCLGGRPDARFLEYPSFETPERAFETFRAAFRENAISVEWRAFAEGFKERQGLRSQDTYRIARARLLREHPSLRWISRASLESVERLPDGRAVGRASALGRSLRVEFAREEFFEATDREGRRIDDFLDRPFREALSVEGDELRLHLRSPLFRGLDSTQVERIVAGAEWKILDIAPWTEP